MSNKNKPTTLDISEDFYTVQAEGITTGVPAYFIRLKSCNLICGGPGGSLMNQGKATWWCDTEAVWRKGLEKPFQYIIDRWNEFGVFDWIKSGRVHIIWTGGEPTIPKHQRAITAFCDWIAESYGALETFNEIETNGTIVITDELFHYLDQINCSPKLANSGMDKKRRIVPQAIERIMEHDNYQFKFVISSEEDIGEITKDYVEPFDIPATRVVLMPGLDKQEHFHERTRFVYEMAKKYGFIGISRGHISAWDQTVGV